MADSEEPNLLAYDDYDGCPDDAIADEAGSEAKQEKGSYDDDTDSNSGNSDASTTSVVSDNEQFCQSPDPYYGQDLRVCLNDTDSSNSSQEGENYKLLVAPSHSTSLVCNAPAGRRSSHCPCLPCTVITNCRNNQNEDNEFGGAPVAPGSLLPVVPGPAPVVPGPAPAQNSAKITSLVPAQSLPAAARPGTLKRKGEETSGSLANEPVQKKAAEAGAGSSQQSDNRNGGAGPSGRTVGTESSGQVGGAGPSRTDGPDRSAGHSGAGRAGGHSGAGRASGAEPGCDTHNSPHSKQDVGDTTNAK